MPEWLMWVLSGVAIVMAVAWSYAIDHILRELGLIRGALEDIHVELFNQADSTDRNRRESEMLALGLDPSDLNPSD